MVVDLELVERVAQVTDQLTTDELRDLHRRILAREDPREHPRWALVAELFTRHTYRYGPGTAVPIDTLIAIGTQVIARRKP